MKTKEELLKIYSSEQLLSLEDLPDEIWKPLPELEEYYHVSNYGRLKSLDRPISGVFKHNNIPFTRVKYEKILTNKLDQYGYSLMRLKVDGKLTFRKTHRMVAICFIPNPENKPMVNHKNGIKHDNRVENLEWCTAKENINHAYEKGLNTIQLNHHLWERKVINTETGIIYNSLTKAAKAHNCRRNVMHNMINRKYKKHINSPFQYYNENI